ncbi:hypothetical protein P8452_68648 [Trifolium repens]|nr:hypothetical protein P8452_68648 [Trifolium repens]
MRKKLLRTWALHWWDFTSQPIDEIYSYYGAKIAIYFAFLGMYTRWLFFLAAFDLTLQLIDFRSMKLVVLPVFFVVVILWAIMFCQFWKRKNSALLARCPLSSAVATDPGYQIGSSLQPPMELLKVFEADRAKGKEVFHRYECYLLSWRTHLYEVIGSDVIKFGLTAVYLFAIQYITKIGGQVSVKLIKNENNENTGKRADSLVYKVFGLYFMQPYIGIFYHALLHRNFSTLRKVLIQRLLLSEVLENLVENSLPYLKYSYKKYKVRHKKKREKGESIDKFQFSSRVEKEYLKPSYSASIGEELEDGLFDDFL